MKKLLGVIVVTLAFSVNSFSNHDNGFQKLSIGNTAKVVCKKMGHTCQGNNVVGTIFYPKFNTEIWWIDYPNFNTYFLVFEKVTAKTKFSWTNYKFNNKYYGDTVNPKEGGLLKEKVYGSLDKAKFAANPDLKKAEKQRIAEEKKKKEEEKRIAEKSNEQIIELQNCKNIWKSSDPHRLNVSIDLNSLKITNQNLEYIGLKINQFIHQYKITTS